MAERDRHGVREQKIFSLFADVCVLAIQPDSIEKRRPPQPDILCKIEREGSVAFEMVELIDQGLAQRTHEQIRFQRLFEDAYQSLPVNKRTELEKHFGNALVHVAFHPDISSRVREDAIPLVFCFLQKLCPSFMGNSSPETRSPLHKVVRKITVSRGDFVGPCFDTEAGGPFADHTLERIRQKFEKIYENSFPIELLAYYELQPVLPDDLWLPRLRTFIGQHLGGSRFRRVWVYDIKSKEIKFVGSKQSLRDYFSMETPA